MTDEYMEKIQDGQEFQDFVTIQLFKCGIVVNPFSSRKYQVEHGESLAGIEIKYDRRFRETGNFYIEYQEKSDERNPFFVDSGILRNDNTWLWVIGDYYDLYIIPKKDMVRLYRWCCENKKAMAVNGIRFVEIGTSKGMLVPVSTMDERYCIKHIQMSDEKTLDSLDYP